MVETSKTTHEHHEQAEPCIFCKIIQGVKEAQVLIESRSALAIMSLEGHPIVLTKSHVDDSNRSQCEEEIVEMFRLANSMDSIVREVYGVSSINIVQNRGQEAGQEISHYHVHLIPRKVGDGAVRFRTIVLPKEKILELATSMKSRLSSN